ncbi:RTA1-domain-containing protein [Rickenella mellea]|uniref:RTA1-domain-containing protein n=1 Tax=Rickenella mellea TaxID=50990 RepID=A0A4Y7PNX5_9AGAM|nr:RTA1-domain-containing protein [Rickenella mellea]
MAPSAPPPSFNAQFDSQYHYVPTKSVCIIFLALFGLSGLLHIVEAFYFRMHWLLATAVLACVGEAIGWSGRYWSSLNWGREQTPFLMQISTTIISPTFLLAVYFVLLGRIILMLGPQYSRLPPKYYLRIFCTVDVIALVVQAVGGAWASVAVDPRPGGRVMLYGIIFQLVALIAYNALGAEFFWRFYFDRPTRSRLNSLPPSQASSTSDISPKQDINRLSKRMQVLICGIVFSNTCIFIRGVYRTIELSDGWNGRIISTQVYFNVLDGAMILLATATLNILHPGYLMPPAAWNLKY